MFGRIVVGYAGDGAGRDAVLLACRLAALCGGELTVAYPYHPLFATVSSDVAEAKVRGELGALVGADVPLARARFRWCNSSWPVRALHELAAYEQAQLIVLGRASERPDWQVGLMERAVHGAPCSVAVAPNGYAHGGRGEPSEIGVGFADTDEGRAAIEVGCELARHTGGELRILAGSGLSGPLAGYAAMSETLSAAEEEMYRGTRARLERVAKEVAGSPEPHLEVSRGNPVRLLLEASRGLDLLVLGSRGYGPLRQVLLGGVSAPVMRSAHCPVVVLPRGSVLARTHGASEKALAEG